MQSTGYKPKSNIITSGSVPQYLEDDYRALKKMLGLTKMGLVEYAILSYCGNHKGYESDFAAWRMRLEK